MHVDNNHASVALVTWKPYHGKVDQLPLGHVCGVISYMFMWKRLFFML